MKQPKLEERLREALADPAKELMRLKTPPAPSPISGKGEKKKSLKKA